MAVFLFKHPLCLNNNDAIYLILESFNGTNSIFPCLNNNLNGRCRLVFRITINKISVIHAMGIRPQSVTGPNSNA